MRHKLLKIREKLIATTADVGARAAVAVDKNLAQFRAYLESEEFERDLDELGVRLGLSHQELLSESPGHWERALHKLKLISRHAALETYMKRTANPGTLAAKVMFRRFVPIINTAVTGAQLFNIANHCFQIYLKRSRKTIQVDS